MAFFIISLIPQDVGQSPDTEGPEEHIENIKSLGGTIVERRENEVVVNIPPGQKEYSIITKYCGGRLLGVRRGR